VLDQHGLDLGREHVLAAALAHGANGHRRSGRGVGDLDLRLREGFADREGLVVRHVVWASLRDQR